MEIRDLRTEDCGQWLELRERLWPDFSRADLTREETQILADPGRSGVLVAVLPSGQLVGFAEVSLREWAEGCETRPVGYIEAWYVEPNHRRAGIGRKLIDAAEHWAMGRGCTEMGSDAEIANQISRLAHQALGYREVLQVALFSKKLRAP